MVSLLRAREDGLERVLLAHSRETAVLPELIEMHRI
jgi:hypothetical protein